MEEKLKTWEIYFKKEEYTVFNQEINLVKEIVECLSKEDTSFIRKMKEKRVFLCEYSLFKKFNCSALLLNCFSCAGSEIIFNLFNELIEIRTKIVNHGILSHFSEINNSCVGNLVSVVGTCVRVGFRKIESLVSYFQCCGCNKIIRKIVENNIHSNPKCSCKSKSFVFMQNHPEMKCIDKQEIKIQEVYSEEQTKIIEVELFGDLVSSCGPGDLIKVTGIVKAKLIGDCYKLFVECNNLEIRNKNSVDLGAVEGAIMDIEVEGILQGGNLQKDIEEEDANTENTNVSFQVFKSLSQEPDLISILISLLFPNIFGHSLIKEGILVSLFGGTKKYVGCNIVRSEIHVLIIGDPGLGKSKMLLNASTVLPKSTYVSGNFTTNSGLTVSITHDNNNEYMVDAGALVVSDGGVCCIDEFDKIDDHASLFEAMEDQRVSLAKGGVCCSVSARATIIAASNPKGGHFNKNKSLKENIRFDTMILSRFDLVFTLVDDLTEEENYKISNQILKKVKEDNTAGRYNKEIIKKYILHSRNCVNPVLSRGAKQRIKEYYSEIRKNKGVSIRNLESLVRIAEAYARMELKAVASLGHAQRAISLYKKLLIKETDNKKVNIGDLLRSYMDDSGKREISKEELVGLIKQTKQTKTVEEVIEMLNFKGEIIKKGEGRYMIVN